MVCMLKGSGIPGMHRNLPHLFNSLISLFFLETHICASYQKKASYYVVV